jgi:hypothetical protein
VGLPLNKFGDLIARIKTQLDRKPITQEMLLETLNCKTAELSNAIYYLSDLNILYIDRNDKLHWRERPKTE